jgi:4-hydroxybenzoate polyprenyltransferase
MSALVAVARAHGSAARLRAYLREMYPVPQRTGAALLVSASVATQLARIHGFEDRPLSTVTLLGAWGVFTFLLTLRLMDELKDVAVDRSLFPGRPLPSGRVLESDLAGTLAVSASLFVGAHAFSGPALGTAVIALGYAVLMFRWFFVPDRMRRSLPLALATHTPVIPLLLLHLVAVFSVTHGLGVRDLHGLAVAALVLAVWAGFFSWEIARKIRAPEEETAYVTYSRLLGARGAVALAASAQTLSLGLGLWLFARHGFSPAFVPPAVGGYLIALGGHVRFLRAPSPTTSRLRPFAEAQVFGLLLGGALA